MAPAKNSAKKSAKKSAAKSSTSEKGRSSPIWNVCARFSIPKDKDRVFAEGLQEKFEFHLKELGADKYIFQLEDSYITKTKDELEEIKAKYPAPLVAPTHNLHFQVFFHLKNKKRVTHLIKMNNESEFKGMHMRPASAKGVNALSEYCMKAESRVAGPWSDSPLYLGADLITRDQMSKQQSNFLNYLDACDPVKHSHRCIEWIYDPVGGSGKSAFKKWCQYHRKWVGFTYAAAKDILYIVSKFPNRRVYFFNLSKTRSSEVSENELYAALESVKDGDFLSTKYIPEQIMMNPAHAVVFANHVPKAGTLTRGRLRVHKWDPLPASMIKSKFEWDFGGTVMTEQELSDAQAEAQVSEPKESKKRKAEPMPNPRPKKKLKVDSKVVLRSEFDERLRKQFTDAQKRKANRFQKAFG